ncbi:MAG: hypothetical protein ABR591_04090 [Candidatus Velthaea sp.]
MAVESSARELRATHFALTAEPPDAAPGGTIRLRYRLRNAAAVESPAARVHFLLPSAATAHGSVECALAPVPPGEFVDVDVSVTVAADCDDETELVFQAALLLDDAAPLGSNRARVVVRGTPRLHGERTCLTITRGEHDDEIVVGATVVNDGNASAQDLTLVVPAPFGTQALDAPEIPTFAIDRIAAGARTDVAFRARIVSPPGAVLRAAGAYVRDAAGQRVALPTSAELRLDGFLAAPVLGCEVAGRRATVTLHAHNTAWGALEQTPVLVRWPAGFRLVRESLDINGAPAREASASAHELRLILERIAGRSTVAVAFVLYATSTARGGELSARVGQVAHEVRAPLAWSPRRSIAIDVVAQPEAPVEAGSVARLSFEIRNAGDCTRRLTLAAARECDDVILGGKRLRAHQRVALPPGAVKAVDVEAPIAADATDGERIAVELRAVEDGEIIAARSASVVACDRVWFDTSRWLHVDGSRPRIELHNCGASTARSAVVTFVDGARVVLGDIAPGATGAAELDAVQAAGAVAGADITWSNGRTLRLQAPPTRTGDRGATLSITAPAAATAGTAIPLGLRVTCTRPVETLRLRMPDRPHVGIAAGSTAVNGHALADTCGGPALANGGLALHAVPRDTPVDVTLRIVVDPLCPDDAAIAVCFDVEADGVATACTSEPIAITALHAFATHSHALPFLVEGGVVQAATPASAREHAIAELPAAPAAPQPLRLAVRLDADGIETMLRLLRGAPATGLISHVLALRALFPDAAAPCHPHVAQTIASVREALRAVLDRLYVKLRIPYFDVCAADCEDLSSRRSLVAFLAAVARETHETTADGGARVLWTAIDASTARECAAALEHEPLGAARALAALAALLPVHCDAAPVLGRALATYVAGLRAALEQCADLSTAEYEQRLAHGPERALDDARAGLVAALAAEAGAHRAAVA